MAEGDYGGAKPKIRKGPVPRHSDDTGNSCHDGWEGCTGVSRQKSSHKPTQCEGVNTDKMLVRSAQYSRDHLLLPSSIPHCKKAKQGDHPHSDKNPYLVKPRTSPKTYSVEKGNSSVKSLDRTGNNNKKQIKRPSTLDYTSSCDGDLPYRFQNRILGNKENRLTINSHSVDDNMENGIDSHSSTIVNESPSVSISDEKHRQVSPHCYYFLSSPEDDLCEDMCWSVQQDPDFRDQSAGITIDRQQMCDLPVPCHYSARVQSTCNNHGTQRTCNTTKRTDDTLEGTASDDEGYDDGRAQPSCNDEKQKKEDSERVTLKHALPYLPTPLRNRLTTGEGFWSAGRSGGQVVAGSLTDHRDQIENKRDPVGTTEDATQPHDTRGYNTAHNCSKLTHYTTEYSTTTVSPDTRQYDEACSSCKWQQDNTHTSTTSKIPIKPARLYQAGNNTNTAEKKYSDENIDSQKETDRTDLYGRLSRIFSRFRKNGVGRCHSCDKECNTDDCVQWIDRDRERFEDSLEDPFHISHDDTTEDLIEEINAPLVVGDDEYMMSQYTRNTVEDQTPTSHWERPHGRELITEPSPAPLLDSQNDSHLQTVAETEAEPQGLPLLARQADDDVSRQAGTDGNTAERRSSDEVLASLLRDFRLAMRTFDSIVMSGRDSVESSLLDYTSGGSDVDGSLLDGDGDPDRETRDEVVMEDTAGWTGGEERRQSDSQHEGAAVASSTDGQHNSLDDIVARWTMAFSSEGMIVQDFNLLIRSSIREILEIESLIQERLSIQLELFNSPAMPATPETVIEALPTITLTSQAAEQSPSCPICLCQCETEDLLTQLPCQHVFHPPCVRAWLLKSGTCPVCRHFVT